MDVKISGDRKRDVSIIFAIVIVLVFFLISVAISNSIHFYTLHERISKRAQVN